MRALRRVSLAGLAACAIGLLLDLDGAAAEALNLLVCSVALSGVALVCLRVVLQRRERVAWSAIALGSALFAFGYLLWALHLRELADPPYPSVADAANLTFYPLSYLGLGLLVRSRVVRFEPSVWLDGVIAALAIAAVGSALVFPFLLTGTGGDFAVVATNFAYPMVDLVMLGSIALIMAMTGWRPGRVWVLMGIGFGLIACADSIYLVLLAEERFVPGGLLDLLWPAGLVLIGHAAWEPHRRTSAVLLESWRTMTIPSVFALTALGVLVYGLFEPVSAVASALAAATVAAVVARTTWTLRELRHLSESRRLALTDELTGLGNRRLFLMRLRAMIGEAKQAGASVALLILDLDGFKELNDTLGHQAGDAVLEQLGVRLAQTAPRSAVVARLGGDEFGLAVPVRGYAEGAELAGTLKVALAERFHVHDLLLQMGGSIGIAVFPEHAAESEELVQRADIALYQAKERPGSHAFYAPDRDSTSRDRLYLAQELRTGIARGELRVHYQPQVDLATGAIAGVEALVRWQHPSRGLVPPGRFLPLTERTDLARDLTRRVVTQVVADLERWRAMGLTFRAAVNLSAADLLDDGLVGSLQRTLASAGLTPADLMLEMTEGIVVSDRMLGMGVVSRLHDSGFELSLDDFGTGHSSLSRLHELPLTEVKIDRSFIMRTAADASARGIVRSVADLAENLSLRVVAEGIEDAETSTLVRDLGCALGQGYHFARPVPAAELPAALDALVPWRADLATPPAGDPARRSPGVESAARG